MHSCPSKHGIHKISSLSGTYGNNLHVRLTLDFLVIFPYANNAIAIPETYNSHGEQILLYRLPSSSRAYPLSFDKKVEAYQRMFLSVLNNEV